MPSQSSKTPSSPSTELAHRRLQELLARLSQQGLTQNQAAAKASLPPQYLSDVKNARRPLTELVARRQGEVFHVSHEWLLGNSDAAEIIDQRRVWLPLFSHPISGSPRDHPQWDGKGIEIGGPAMAQLAQAKLPYVLQFNHTDVLGRLHKGDLILISQACHPDAEISVVQVGNKCYLARRQTIETWRPVAPHKHNARVRPREIVGYCVGIIWSALAARWKRADLDSHDEAVWVG